MSRALVQSAAAAILAALLCSWVLSGCAASADAHEQQSGPQIVVTTNILGDVVEQIAGNEAQVTTLMRPNADPHSFGISAQEAALLGSADLIVSNGLGLEEGLQQHLDRAAAQDIPLFVAGEHIEVLNYRSADAAGSADPHFWTDPARMIDVIDGLESALSEIAGVNPAAIRSNAGHYRDEVQQLDSQMRQSFVSIPRERRALVTNHHVFGYLAERFDFEIIGAVIPGGTTLASPSAADLRELSSAIEQAGVPTIFAESSQSDRLVQVLASEAGVHVRVVELFTESLTRPGEGADSYLTMMRTNTERITSGLNN